MKIQNYYIVFAHNIYFLDENGEIDWDVSDINEWDLFPLKREKVK
jgi:hypothetical protein